MCGVALSNSVRYELVRENKFLPAVEVWVADDAWDEVEAVDWLCGDCWD
jgi:hypothetical protein